MSRAHLAALCLALSLADLPATAIAAASSGQPDPLAASSARTESAQANAVPTTGTRFEPAWALRAALREQAGTPSGAAAATATAVGRIQAARIALGRKLFFDRRLSVNNTQSCGMCHVPEQGFTSNELQVAVGVHGRNARRNAPTVLNVGFYERLFVDGRDNALETQYLMPLLSRDEMANPSLGHVIEKLRAFPDYAGWFEHAFGQSPSADSIGSALAAYQRSLRAAGDSSFDRWHDGGDESALSELAREGYALFTGRAGCEQCHRIQAPLALFTDQGYHDTGYGWMREQQRQHPPETVSVQVAPGVFHTLDRAVVEAVGNPPTQDLGRYELTQDPADLWRYRTPQLRNVALTAPYMHDGGLPTLEAVVAFYDAGGAPHAGASERIRPLNLSQRQAQALVHFLRSLTSPTVATLVGEARSEPPDR